MSSFANPFSLPSLFFKELDRAAFDQLFIPLACAQIFIAISSIINIIAVSRQVNSIIVWHTIWMFAIIGVFWPLSKISFFEQNLTLSILMASLIAFVSQLRQLPQLFEPSMTTPASETR